MILEAINNVCAKAPTGVGQYADLLLGWVKWAVAAVIIGAGFVSVGALVCVAVVVGAERAAVPVMRQDAPHRGTGPAPQPGQGSSDASSQRVHWMHPHERSSGQMCSPDPTCSPHSASTPGTIGPG